MKWAISCPRGWRGKGCENRQALRSFAVRAPCAHHWQANAPHMARCFAKKRLATGTGKERAAKIAKPFTAEGLALKSEREVRSSLLSRAIALPPAGERPCAKLSPFTRHAHGRARLCGALARCESIRLPVGRARGAPCKTAARSAIGETIASPLAAGPWRRRHGHSPVRSNAAAPSHSPARSPQAYFWS